MKLVEDRKLDLDVPVTLKTWKLPASEKPITLRRLLSHTAGVNAPEQVAYVKPDGTLSGYAPGTPLPTTLQILNGEPPAITAKVELLSPIPTASSTRAAAT
jgi:CubicO group peptidase (beta-lactamase class C family)